MGPIQKLSSAYFEATALRKRPRSKRSAKTLWNFSKTSKDPVNKELILKISDETKRNQRNLNLRLVFIFIITMLLLIAGLSVLFT